jgi:DNA polymerase kappa
MASEVGDEQWSDDAEAEVHDDNDDDDFFGVAALDASNSVAVDATSATLAPVAAPFLSRLRVDTSKAGMEGIDRAHVDAIVADASKNSKFNLRQLQRQEANAVKIREMLAVRDKCSADERRVAEREADALLAQFEASMTFNRTFMHVDMDMFYCAVEQRDDPSLADVPFAVGSNFMLMTSNYVARRFGVRAGMPGFIARRLCPSIVFVRPSFEKYKLASRQVKEVLSRLDPDLVSFSLDEALLDITDFLAANPAHTAASLAEQVHKDVVDATGGLTCSIGLASNSGIAKIGADMRKPNGTFHVGPSRLEVREFLSGLAVAKVSGIGKVLAAQLAALQVSTVADLFRVRADIVLCFTPKARDFLLQTAVGAFSSRPTSERHAPRKSISCERTTTPLSLESDLYDFLRAICEHLARDLVAKNLRGRSLSIKAKTTTFVIQQRSMRLEAPLGGEDVDLLFRHAKSLLSTLLPITVRLLGVRVADFEGEDEESRADNVLPQGQTRIDEFLATHQAKALASSQSVVAALAEARVERFLCPVCAVDLSGRRAVEASVHVDRCLTLPPAKRAANSSTSSSSTSSSASIDQFFRRKSEREG